MIGGRFFEAQQALARIQLAPVFATDESGYNR